MSGVELCGATDGLGDANPDDPSEPYGRCTLPKGHGTPNAPMAWHREMRDGELWVEWRGPNPDEVCRICGVKGSEH